MDVAIEVSERFEDYLTDWDYKTYVLLGAYGSSKSYSTAEKIVLKCLQEKRKVLVVRQVFATIFESCYDLFMEIMTNWDLLDTEGSRVGQTRKVIYRKSPLSFIFPNGSRIIFKGVDKPMKLKSLNGVSIVWIEEATELRRHALLELYRGRIRHPSLSVHFIFTFNPTDKNTAVYDMFFVHTDNKGKQHIILDDNILYERKTVVVKNVYYHHSLPEDNMFLPLSYVRQLEEIKDYDPDLYRVARLGRFGVNGRRVLPQFRPLSHEKLMNAITALPEINFHAGMDFGFENSYNAVVRCAIDYARKYLFVFWEYYANQMTDDETADELEKLGLKDVVIYADNEDPKAIRYYKKRGFRMKSCKKFAGSRLANTRKMKRFKRIYVSRNCPNTIRELEGLTYAVDEKTGELKYDVFNIDPHTFSALWYALDRVDIVDMKTARNTTVGGKRVG